MYLFQNSKNQILSNCIIEVKKAVNMLGLFT